MITVFQTCTPREDVLAGTIAESDFAADLAKVIRGNAPEAYQNPKLFFENTYPTRGLQNLLANVCRRLSGAGGEAASIFRLDTQYGGGKTHGLIALIHAARGMEGVANPAEFVDPALLPKQGIRVAAFDGEMADPANGHDLGGGVRAHTPWGEIAFALAGPAGYESVRESDIQRVAPGSATLEALFGGDATLILLDELPIYLRKVMHIPAAREQLTAFMTSLFKAVESSPRAALVYTLAVGKEGKAIDAYAEEHQFIAQKMMELESVSARKATLLNPTEDDETVQVIRRRLFKQIDLDKAAPVFEAYQHAWQAARDHLPIQATRPETVDALRQSYPLHPDVLETLTTKTATLGNFQRVRGMLRVLARTVANVWKEKPADATTIHVHHIDPGHELIRQEFFTRLQQGAYAPAVRSDVSSHDAQFPSLAEQLDDEHYRGLPPYASYVARTAFLHTLAFNEQLKGLGPEHLRFSLLSPALDISFIDDARKRFMTDSAYIDDRPNVPMRFLAEANLTQIIRRQEQDVDPAEVRTQLNDRIKSIFQGPFLNLVAFPAGAYEVPDEVGDGRPLLVVIGYDAVSVGGIVDTVPELIRRIYTRKGSDETSLRGLRNNLVFVVADDSRKDHMRQKMIRRLALAELRRPERLQELAEHQREKVRGWESQSEGDVAVAIQQCYRHVFYPSRNRIEGQDVDLAHTAVEIHSASADPGAGQRQIVRALRDNNKLRLSEDQPDSPAYIRDRTPLKNGQITTRALREEFRRDPNLPMLVNDDLLIRAILNGVQQGDYVYRRNSLLFGQGDPNASIQIDEQANVFTMSFAKANGIWPRVEVEPPTPPPPGGVDIGGGTPPQPVPPPAPPPTPGALTEEGVLREALARLFERVRGQKIGKLAALRVRMFDASDAFRLVAAASQVPGAQKHVSITAAYESTENATFQCEFAGVLTEVFPVRDFLDPQLRAAREKSIDAEVTLRFDGGLDMSGDGADKVAERLTRQAMGAAYVTATAEPEQS